MTALYLNWPADNGDLDRVELRNGTIYDHDDRDPPTNITSGWKPGASRSLNPGETARLDFRFTGDAVPGGYSLSVTLNGVCSVSGGQ